MEDRLAQVKGVLSYDCYGRWLALYSDHETSHNLNVIHVVSFSLKSFD